MATRATAENVNAKRFMAVSFKVRGELFFSYFAKETQLSCQACHRCLEPYVSEVFSD